MMQRFVTMLPQYIITENISFEFIILLILWEQILCSLYAVSKQLQSKSVNLSTAIVLLKEAVDFVCQWRNKFDDVCQTAESTATKWDIVETTFKETHIRTKKRFLEELLSDCRLETSRDRFRVTNFLLVVDTCFIQLRMRFESLQSITGLFSFCFQIS